MKLHQIAFAVAALAAGSAQAAAPADATFTINMDGATALGGSVTDVSAAMCSSAATTQKYKGTNSKLTAVYCNGVNTVDSGLAAGTKLWISKNNVDGSAEAFLRALNQEAQTLTIDPATCPAPTYAGTVLTCTGTKLVNANGGFSDVEGDIWKARGVWVPAAGVTYTTKAGFAGQGFGVAVTNKLYAALQAAQGLTVGDYTVANQPSITKQQFTSILSQTGAYHTDWTPFLGAAEPTATNNMNLCRRVNTSGTQASMEVFFLNNPCSNASPTYGLVAAATAADTAGTFQVYEAPGTGDVKTCLNAHNQNLVNATVGADGTAADEYAIGIMSLENNPGGSDYWHFVKLDGVTPTPDANNRQTVVDGQYNFAFESVFVYRNDAATNSTAQKNFMNKFVGLMGNPAKVNPLVGVFSVPGASSYTAYPSRVHRGSTGGNSCSPFSLAE